MKLIYGQFFPIPDWQWQKVFKNNILVTKVTTFLPIWHFFPIYWCHFFVTKNSNNFLTFGLETCWRFWGFKRIQNIFQFSMVSFQYFMGVLLWRKRDFGNTLGFQLSVTIWGSHLYAQPIKTRLKSYIGGGDEEDMTWITPLNIIWKLLSIPTPLTNFCWKISQMLQSSCTKSVERKN